MHITAEIDDLIYRELDGEATPEEAERLRALAAADPEFARYRLATAALFARLHAQREAPAPPGLAEEIKAALRRSGVKPPAWASSAREAAPASAPERGAPPGFWARLFPAFRRGGPSVHRPEITLLPRGGIMPGATRFKLQNVVVMASLCVLMAASVVFLTFFYPPVSGTETQGAIGKRDVYRETQVAPTDLGVEPPNTLNVESFRRFAQSAEFKSMSANTAYQLLANQPIEFQALLQNEVFLQLVKPNGVYSTLMANVQFQSLVKQEVFQQLVKSEVFQGLVESANQAALGLGLWSNPTGSVAEIKSGLASGGAGGGANNIEVGSHADFAANFNAAIKSVNLGAFGPKVFEVQKVLGSSDFQSLLKQQPFQQILGQAAFGQLLGYKPFAIVIGRSDFQSLMGGSAFQAVLQSEPYKAQLCAGGLLSGLQNNPAYAAVTAGAAFQALAKNADFQAVMKSVVFSNSYLAFSSLLSNPEFMALLKSASFQQNALALCSYFAAHPAVQSALGDQHFAAALTLAAQAVQNGAASSFGDLIIQSAAYKALMKSGANQALAQAGFASFVQSAPFSDVCIRSNFLNLMAVSDFQALLKSNSFGALVGAAPFQSLCKSEDFLGLMQNSNFQALMGNAAFGNLIQNTACMNAIASHAEVFGLLQASASALQCGSVVQNSLQSGSALQSSSKFGPTVGSSVP